MNPIPSLESRMSAQEQQQALLSARMFELSQDIVAAFEHTNRKIEAVAVDMTLSFKQQARYQIQLEEQIETRFTKVEEDIASVKADVTSVKADIAAMKTTMATKEDLKALETRMEQHMETLEMRMLDAFKQLLTTVESRLPLQA